MHVGDLSLMSLFLVLFGLTAGRYIFFSGLSWIVFYWVLPNRLRHRKVIPQSPSWPDVRRELLQSLSSMIAFAIVGCLTFIVASFGWTQLYNHIDAYGWAWFGASIAIAILLHDTYFYWTHRLLHHPALFSRIHLAHHRSINPTPWAAYSFSPWEALIEAGIFPLIALSIPIHPAALSIFMIWQILFNVLGHTGYEYNHRFLATSCLRFILNTPTNHALHHHRPRGNYGLYFNWWDRLLGTNSPDYDLRLREITSRLASDRDTSPT